jgi:type II secretory pathway pseudopilin PulG
VTRSFAKHRQRGISLVEIALTLVIVALVLAGVLAGREMITQSQAKAVAADFNSLIGAYVSYQDRYNALPGDDPRAAVRWASQSARSGTGDGFIGGTYEAPAPAASALQTFTIDASQGESLNYWWHLRLSDFVLRPPGSASAATQPLNAFAGIVGVQMNGAGLAGVTLCQANLPGKIAGAVDAQLDDTRPATGQMRGLRQTTTPQPLATATPVTAYSEGDATIYVLCRTP